MTSMSVEYDCGFTLNIPIALKSNDTLLHQSALGDTMISLADATHDQECEKCK